MTEAAAQLAVLGDGVDGDPLGGQGVFEHGDQAGEDGGLFHHVELPRIAIQRAQGTGGRGRGRRAGHKAGFEVGDAPQMPIDDERSAHRDGGPGQRSDRDVGQRLIEQREQQVGHGGDQAERAGDGRAMPQRREEDQRGVGMRYDAGQRPVFGLHHHAEGADHGQWDQPLEDQGPPPLVAEARGRLRHGRVLRRSALGASPGLQFFITVTPIVDFSFTSYDTPHIQRPTRGVT
ncbi:MAG: hypothetical protein KC620_07045 [Myxococcales bacterium]|nr:hypothetical protein [Myxococcales bacterium]